MASKEQTDLSIATATTPTPSTGKPVAPKSVPAITPDDLKTQPVINVPTPKLPTQGTTLQADLAIQAEDAFTAQQKAASESSKTVKDDALAEYLKAITGSQGEIGLTDKAYKDSGVDSAQVELNKYNDQLRQEQRALDLARRNITEKGGGLKMGAQAELNNIERESLQKQADIAILQMSAQGKYDSAKAIADRAVAAKLEQQNIYNAALKFAYGEAKDTFTKAEQREFETLLGNRERTIKKAEQEASSIYELGIQAQHDGAPDEVVKKMFAAKTKEEAAAIGGSYIGALDREAKRANIAQSWASVANSRRTPTTVIDRGNGNKQLINSQTGEVIAEYGSGELAGVEPYTPEQSTVAATGIQQIDALKSHKGLNSSVGPVKGTRIALFDAFGQKDDFIASIDQLTKDLTLTNLVNAKANGATFGALSNAELQLLSESATKINNWRKGETNSEGAVIQTKYYDASEKDFKKELDKISNFRKLDYVLKGGDPAQVGIVPMEDGTFWTVNSDGTYAKIR